MAGLIIFAGVVLILVVIAGVVATFVELWREEDWPE